MELYDVKDYEGLYKIDKKGNVFSIKRNMYKKAQPDKDGYLRIGLRKNKKFKLVGVHRLVGLTFIDNPNNYEIIDHIDRNNQNNHVENLRWINLSGNSRNRKTTENKLRGVRQTPSGKYRAEIKINNKKIHLGTFETDKEAYECYINKYTECLSVF